MADKENSSSGSTPGIDSASGVIRKMFNDTKTRKAVRGKIVDIDTSADEKLDDPLSMRNTDTGNLKKMLENTKTRKTVKLKPLSGQNPVQVAKLVKEPTAASAARQTIKLKTSDAPSEVKAAELQKVHDEAIAKAQSRKTIKLKSAPQTKMTAQTSSIPKENATELPDETAKVSSDVKPGIKKAPVAAVPLTPAGAAAPAGKTRKIGEEETVADPLKKRDSNTGAMKKILDDTKTRKTVKLKKTGIMADQQAETVIEAAPQGQTAVNPPVGKARSSQTQKFKARQTQRFKARGRGAVPGAKDTIKLRPSAGDKAASAVKANANKQTIRMAPVASTNAADTIKLSQKPKAAGSADTIKPTQKPKAKAVESSDTIKLTTKAKDPNKKPIPAKTAGVKKPAQLGVKTAKHVGEEILATDKGDTSGNVQKARLVQQAKFATETAQTIALDDAGNDKASSLGLPKRLQRKSSAPTAPTQKLEIPQEEEQLELPGVAPTGGGSGGGLKVKQTAAPEGAGAPMAQKGEEEFGEIVGKKKKRSKAQSGDVSVIYTILAVASLILIGAAAYVSTAQLINTWEQKRVGTQLPIPVINGFVDKIGE